MLEREEGLQYANVFVALRLHGIMDSELSESFIIIIGAGRG